MPSPRNLGWEELGFLVLIGMVAWLCLPDRIELAHLVQDREQPEEVRLTLERQLSTSRTPGEQSAVYRRLARLALEEGDPERALQQARAAALVTPASVRPLVELAQLQELFCRPNDAAESLERAVGLYRQGVRDGTPGPGFEAWMLPFRQRLAWYQRFAQQVERAIQTHRELVRDHPESTSDWRQLAILEAQLGHDSEAAEARRRAAGRPADRWSGAWAAPAPPPQEAVPAAPPGAPLVSIPDRAARNADVVSRRVLALFKRSEGESAGANRVHAALEVPLNYLGLVVDYHAVEDGLPGAAEMERYRGVVTWFGTEPMLNATSYICWLALQTAAGRRAVILARLGCTTDQATGRSVPPLAMALLGKALGLRPARLLLRRPGAVTILAHDTDMCEFERGLGLEAETFADLESADPRNRVHLTLGLRDQPQLRCHAIVTGPHGGFCLDGYAIHADPERHRDQWRLDPFRFLEESLALQGLPRPDFTTRNGQRLVYTHADGGGLDERCEWLPLKSCAEAFRTHVLERRDLPWTVSFLGCTADLKHRLAADKCEAARQVLAHPNIEWRGPACFHGSGGRCDPDHPSILGLRPVHRIAEGALQDLSAAPSDYLLTEGWQQPAPSVINLLRTFEATGAPRRLTPVDVYVHFALLATRAGARCLDDVLDWVESRGLNPISVTELMAVTRGFRSARIIPAGEGVWRVSDYGRCLTLRFDGEPRWPDLARCRGVAGFSRQGQALYVHLLADAEALVALTAAPALHLHVASSTAAVQSASAIGSTGLQLVLEGRGKRTLALGGLPPAEVVHVDVIRAMGLPPRTVHLQAAPDGVAVLEVELERFRTILVRREGERPCQ